MNFELSEEQEFLREAARGTLARVDTLAAARDVLEARPAPDLWGAACEAGWPGLMIAERHGGAELGLMDAMLVFEETGRVLAGVPLLGHLPATFLLDRAGAPGDLLAALAAGEQRAALIAARPPSDLDERWTVDPRYGSVRQEAGEEASWVPDAPGADVIVAVTATGGAVLVDDAEVEPVVRYDGTRLLGHVRFDPATATPLEVPPGTAAAAWHVAQSLIAAESLGAADRALEVSVEYAKERFAFGRPIGSYQAVKHTLVEMLRLADNARSLMYYAGWAGADRPDELPVAAAAFRLAAGKALEYAARAQISVHGGIGATWEHDAPLYFRRAQLSRRLLGGTAAAADVVAADVLRRAAA